jgi:hypothetical protein
LSASSSRARVSSIRRSYAVGTARNRRGAGGAYRSFAPVPDGADAQVVSARDRFGNRA